MTVKTAVLPASSALLAPFLLGLMIAGIVYATWTGKSLPLIGSPKAAMIALLVIGMTLCGMGGIGQVAASGKWASPLAILGYLLGTLLLVVLVGGLFGWKLPLITSERETVLASAVLMGAKYLIGTLGYLFHLL